MNGSPGQENRLTGSQALNMILVRNQLEISWVYLYKIYFKSGKSPSVLTIIWQEKKKKKKNADLHPSDNNDPIFKYGFIKESYIPKVILCSYKSFIFLILFFSIFGSLENSSAVK